MKKINLIILLLVVSLSFQSPLWAIDEKELLDIISSADTEESGKAAHSAAMANPDLLEKIVFIPASQLSNRVGRANAIAFLKLCVIENKITQAHFFNIICRLLSDINTYVEPMFREDVKDGLCFIMGGFGFDRKLSISERVKTLQEISNVIFKNNLINHRPLNEIVISRTDKALQILTDSGNKGRAEVTLIIEAIVKDVDLQSNKQLPSEAAKIISLYCENLLEELSKEP
jgi:hypothetical protein